MKSDLLSKALKFSSEKHADQMDKQGKPYFFHCLRVMMNLDSKDQELCAIAVLHDVVEDTDATLDDLRNIGMTERVVVAVDLMTKRTDLRYEDYIEGVSSNQDSIRVKLADLKDNMDPNRKIENDSRYDARIKKYEKAKEYLLTKLDK